MERPQDKPSKNWKPRLPIDHPDYIYPPSRNPYYQKTEVLQKSYDGSPCVALDHESEKYKGQWLKAFNKKSLSLEIGSNAGHVLLEYAEKHPDCQYVGIDWKYKTTYRAAEKALKRNIKNAIFLRAHAERLYLIFDSNELDEIKIFFPDPWPKKAHWGNRFICTERLKMLHDLLKEGSILHIKTDHPGYFDWMLDALVPLSELWEIVDLNRDLHRGHPCPEKLQIPDVTLFEKIFIRDKIPIQSLKLKAIKHKK